MAELPSLAGLRVVEYAALGPLAHCGLVLAALGASIDRIDRPGLTDADRRASEDNALNRGRRSVVLDLKTADGAAAARELMSRADVVLEGHRPGAMERLGLAPDDVLPDNPRLIYARMTGWGAMGPRAARPGHDINYLAVSGLLDAIGTSTSGPVPPLMLLGDFAGGGLNLAVAVLAAVVERERSGRGQVIDASILEGTMSLGTFLYGALTAGRWQAARGTNAWDTGAPWYNVYRTRDDRWLSVGAVEPPFYAAFMTGLGLDPDPALQWRREQWPAVKEQVASVVAERDLADWVARFAGVEACVEPVLTPLEALADDATIASGAVVEGPCGAFPRVVPSFSRSAAVELGAPPVVGADQQQILGELGSRPDTHGIRTESRS